MDKVTFCTRRAFIPAVLVGSFGAPTIWATLTVGVDLVSGGSWSQALWLVPMTGLGFGFIACLFVAIGLAIFGFPAIWLLRPFLRQRWMILIAAAWGGVAGEIVAGVLLGEHFQWRFNSLNLLFILYGCVTGIAWFAYYQHAAKTEEEKDNERATYFRWLNRD